MPADRRAGLMKRDHAGTAASAAAPAPAQMRGCPPRELRDLSRAYRGIALNAANARCAPKLDERRALRGVVPRALRVARVARKAPSAAAITGAPYLVRGYATQSRRSVIKDLPDRHADVTCAIALPGMARARNPRARRRYRLGAQAGRHARALQLGRVVNRP